MRAGIALLALICAGCSIRYSESKALEGSSGTAASSGSSGAGSSGASSASAGSSSSTSGSSSSTSGSSSSTSSSSSSGSTSGSSGGQLCQGSVPDRSPGACTANPLGAPFFAPPVYGAPTDVAMQPAALCGGPAWLTAGLDPASIVSVQMMRIVDGGLSAGPMFETDGGYGGDESIPAVDLFRDGSVELVLFGDVIDIFQFGPGDVPSLRQRIDFKADFTNAGDLQNLVPYDINHDGWLDLLGRDNGGGTILYLNQQDGSFAPASASVNWGNTYVATAADIAGDGRPLIFDSRGVDATDGGQGSGEIAVYDGDPDPIAIYTPPISTYGLVHFTQDVDGDGLLDLVTLATNMGFTIFYGLPDAGFGRTASVDIVAATGQAALSGLAVGDFNRDCLPDAIAGAYDSLYLYLGLPDGGFDVHPVTDGGVSIDLLNAGLQDPVNLRGWVIQPADGGKPELLWSVGSGNNNSGLLLNQR